MQLPILLYGHQLLRGKAKPVAVTQPGIKKIISDMWQTMYGAGGCGLAAPQVNLPLRIFIVDSQGTFKQMPPEDKQQYFSGDSGIQETFINARITARSAETWLDQEGCLSIPGVWGLVERPWQVTVEYLNADLQTQVKIFSGLTARMIQHEFDHTEGILYLDYLPPLKRIALKKKLNNITLGKIKPGYPVLIA